MSINSDCTVKKCLKLVNKTRDKSGLVFLVHWSI